jgi:biotin transport system substrate-specific component
MSTPSSFARPIVPTVPTFADLLPRPTERSRRLAMDAGLVLGVAVLTALAAQIRIPLGFTPVPVTGQTFAVLLAGTVLGARRGALSQLAYWAIGIVAPMPWYAGDTTGASVAEGWQVATGATAGYLAGFVLAAAAVGYLAERGHDRSFSSSAPAMLAGTAIIYTMGVAWLAFHLSIPVVDGSPNAIELGLTPFLIGDLLKLLLAAVLTPLAWQALDRRS